MNIYNAFPDFDDFNKSDQEKFLTLFKSGSILNINQIQNRISEKAGGFFETIKNNKKFGDISNEYAYSTPFGKNSLFYIAKKNSYRAVLEKKANFHALSSKFSDVDFEKISWSEYSDTINIKY